MRPIKKIKIAELNKEKLEELLEDKLSTRDYLYKCYKNKKARGYYDGYDGYESALDNDLDEISVIETEINDIKREIATWN